MEIIIKFLRIVLLIFIFTSCVYNRRNVVIQTSVSKLSQKTTFDLKKTQKYYSQSLSTNGKISSVSLEYLYVSIDMEKVTEILILVNRSELLPQNSHSGKKIILHDQVTSEFLMSMCLEEIDEFTIIDNQDLIIDKSVYEGFHLYKHTVCFNYLEVFDITISGKHILAQNNNRNATQYRLYKFINDKLLIKTVSLVYGSTFQSNLPIKEFTKA